MNNRPDRVSIWGTEYEVRHLSTANDDPENSIRVVARKDACVWVGVNIRQRSFSTFARIDYWARTIYIYDDAECSQPDLWQAIIREVTGGAHDAPPKGENASWVEYVPEPDKAA